MANLSHLRLALGTALRPCGGQKIDAETHDTILKIEFLAFSASAGPGDATLSMGRVTSAPAGRVRSQSDRESWVNPCVCAILFIQSGVFDDVSMRW